MDREKRLGAKRYDENNFYVNPHDIACAIWDEFEKRAKEREQKNKLNREKQRVDEETSEAFEDYAKYLFGG